MARKAKDTNGSVASDEPKGKDGSSGIQSVSRALGILELFGERRPALTTSEIAGLTGLNRATAYRFCQTLLSLGYLEETRPRTFRPGLKAVSLAQAALSTHELPDLALPYLRELRDATGETVNLALLDGPSIVYVSRLLNESLLALRLYVGSRLPSVASSMGRAMLAYLPEDEVEVIIGPGDIEAVTSKTITDRRRLIAELRRIRNRGYALNDEEVVIGVRGIAAPIFGVSGRPIAAVNVSVAHELQVGEEERLSSKVIETAGAISALAQQLAVDVG